jgi:hypothetical protein
MRGFMEVPNIYEETGLSRNYRLAVGSFIGYLEAIEQGIRGRPLVLQKRSLALSPIRRYEEQFDGYEKVITNENRGNVEKLNSLVDKLNEMRDEGKIKRDNYSELVQIKESIFELIGLYSKRQ